MLRLRVDEATDATIVAASPACERIVGWTAGELVGTACREHVHPEDLGPLLRTVAAGRPVTALTQRLRHRAGHYVWVEATARGVEDRCGAAVELRLAARDAAARRRAEEQLRAAPWLQRTLTACLADTTVLLIDHDARIVLADGPGVRRIVAAGHGELVGCGLAELCDRGLIEAAPDAFEHCVAALRGDRRRLEVRDGAGRTFEVDVAPVRRDDGAVAWALVVARDVTQRRSAELRLRHRARQQEAVARLGQLALRETDPRALLHEVAATCSCTLEVEICAILELREDESAFDAVASTGLGEGCTGAPLAHRADTQPGAALRAGEPLVVADLAADPRCGGPDGLRDRGVVSGVTVPIEGRERPYGVLGCYACTPRRFDADDVNFLTAVANLLSAAVERHCDEQHSRHAALHDPLTGLPNRTLALDRLQRALGRRRRDGGIVATLMLDLDRFKNINDTLGHAAGDELLLALAPRLSEALRPSDTVARLSGDEFLVICSAPAGVRDVIGVAERLAEAVGRPFELDGREHFMTASIGIAIASAPDDTAESLLRDADAAMYRSKRRGPGRFELFDDAMRAQLVTRMRTEVELHRAVAGGELLVHYQPIIDLATGEPLAVEALVRWEHPERGIVAPLDFIPIAEETGLIGDVGLQVLDAACAQAATWQERYDRDLQMFVNVSGRQISSPLFARQVRDIARASGMREGTLGLEVTESVLIEETEAPLRVLERLRGHGLRLVLDDFGRGYSSLAYLKQLPLDGMKIDRSFTNGLSGDLKDVVIVRALVDMAHALGMNVIAEGVETAIQADELRRLGCRHVQGHLFSRPLPAASITWFFDEHLGAREGTGGW